DTLRLTLGFDPKPEVYAWAAVGDATVFLHARILDDAGPSPYLFSWRQRDENPMQVDLANEGDSVASFVLPVDLAYGEYYFDVEVTDASGATGKAGTFLTQSELGLIAFDIWSDHASWVDSAVVYEITPYNFVANGGLQEIRERLSEFVDLGVNTIWLQPVYETFYALHGEQRHVSLRRDTLPTVVGEDENDGDTPAHAPRHTDDLQRSGDRFPDPSLSDPCGIRSRAVNSPAGSTGPLSHVSPPDPHAAPPPRTHSRRFHGDRR
ncbi:MAG TPA: hypothetical protein VMO47_04180, partial [Rhodothermales bacterium]|nr:hypothetical protein [Rhodothermales bacterium]